MKHQRPASRVRKTQCAIDLKPHDAADEARYMNQQVENQIMATQTQLKPQTQSKPLNKRETSNLIGSDKVEGTPVYRTNGDHVGQIERVMIDKLSGRWRMPL